MSSVQITPKRSKSKLQPAAAWSEFERHVRSGLECLGYSVERNCLIHGSQVDLVATRRSELFIHRLIVECKYWETQVGVPEVRDVAAIVESISTKAKCYGGLLVSRIGFTKEAKVFAERLGIWTLTLIELLRLSFDPTPLATQQSLDFEGGELGSKYVELSCQVAEFSAGTIYKPVEAFLDRFLLETKRPGAAVLGNFGTGKTSLSKHYAHLWARRWLSAADNALLPIYIALRDVKGLRSIDDALVAVLKEKYGVICSAAGVQNFLVANKALLIFDGFDEMASRLNRTETHETLQAMLEITKRTEAKILLTCRTHFFKTQLMEEGAFAELLRLYIRDWGKGEWSEYVRKAAPSDYQKVIHTISTTYNLEELAKTPIFLRLITTSMDKMQGSVNQSRLYQIYTDRWIENEDHRSVLSPEHKRFLMEELAFEMHSTSEYRISYEALPGRIRQRLGVIDHVRLQEIDRDVRTCSFLVRDHAGLYYFVHKSFMEYFVAVRLAQQIKEKDLSDFGKAYVAHEIAGFLAHYFTGEYQILIRLLMGDSSAVVRGNAATTLSNFLEKSEVGDALRLAVRTEQDEVARCKVVDAMSKSRSEETIQELLEHAKSDSLFGAHCLRSLNWTATDERVVEASRAGLRSLIAERIVSALENITAAGDLEASELVLNVVLGRMWVNKLNVARALVKTIQRIATVALASELDMIYNTVATTYATTKEENGKIVVHRVETDSEAGRVLAVITSVSEELRRRFRVLAEQDAIAWHKEGLLYKGNQARLHAKYRSLVTAEQVSTILRGLYGSGAIKGFKKAGRRTR